jgi:hypothetical protein
VIHRSVLALLLTGCSWLTVDRYDGVRPPTSAPSCTDRMQPVVVDLSLAAIFTATAMYGFFFAPRHCKDEESFACLSPRIAAAVSAGPMIVFSVSGFIGRRDVHQCRAAEREWNVISPSSHP